MFLEDGELENLSLLKMVQRSDDSLLMERFVCSSFQRKPIPILPKILKQLEKLYYPN